MANNDSRYHDNDQDASDTDMEERSDNGGDTESDSTAIEVGDGDDGRYTWVKRRSTYCNRIRNMAVDLIRETPETAIYHPRASEVSFCPAHAEFYKFYYIDENDTRQELPEAVLTNRRGPTFWFDKDRKFVYKLLKKGWMRVERIGTRKRAYSSSAVISLKRPRPSSIPESVFSSPSERAKRPRISNSSPYTKSTQDFSISQEPVPASRTIRFRDTESVSQTPTVTPTPQAPGTKPRGTTTTRRQTSASKSTSIGNSSVEKMANQIFETMLGHPLTEEDDSQLLTPEFRSGLFLEMERVTNDLRQRVYSNIQQHENSAFLRLMHRTKAKMDSTLTTDHNNNRSDNTTTSALKQANSLITTQERKISHLESTITTVNKDLASEKSKHASTTSSLRKVEDELAMMKRKFKRIDEQMRKVVADGDLGSGAGGRSDRVEVGGDEEARKIFQSAMMIIAKHR